MTRFFRWMLPLLALLAALLSGCDAQALLNSDTAQTAPQPQATRPTTRPRSTPTPEVARIAGFAAVPLGELPPEASDTLQLIIDGGPFPYRQDGSTFQNRERLLPRQPQGYYREYTVETPGSDDRGARRLVVGERGEVFYTEDHYDSFVQVVP